MTRVTVFPLPDKGLAPMRSAEVLASDDLGVTLRYEHAGHENDALVPWAVIGRIEYLDGFEAGAL